MAEAELSKKSIADLRYIAKMMGIKSPTTLKKSELIEKILAAGEIPAEEQPAVSQKQAEKAPEQTGEIDTDTSAVKKGRKKTVKEKKTEPTEENKENKSEISPVKPSVSAEGEQKKKTRGRPSKKNILPKEEKETPGGLEHQKTDAPEPKKQRTRNKNEKAQADTNDAPKQEKVSAETGAEPESPEENTQADKQKKNKFSDDKEVEGILDIVSENYGFLRVENYVASSKDIYVPMVQIKRFNLKTGDKVRGKCRFQKDTEKYQALYYVTGVNDGPPDSARRRKPFETLTPIFPDEKLKLERGPKEFSTRLIDLMAPIGKGQRGMIVSPPKAGKTVLLKQIAHSVTENYPDVHLMVLLVDERPEEVTDMRESVAGDVISSTFDELPERHVKVAEMVLERAQRLVEAGKDVVILMDSLTRLARAYNLTIPPTGRTLSGGIDPGALHKPKKFFGAARNIRDGGSLTIVATALVDTGSKMDDVIFEEFKGTGNMELHLDRKLSEKRIFPAIDINKSGTRREDLLLSEKELNSVFAIRKALSNMGTADVTEILINQMQKCDTNEKFVESVKLSFKD